MLPAASELQGFAIRATEGEIGSVHDLLFDDQAWTVRYVVVDTGRWLPGRRVLLSPRSVVEPDWLARTLRVDLTREQVERSPDVDADRPVSRQREVELAHHYGHPYYWAGPYRWGAVAYPGPVAVPPPAPGPVEREVESRLRESGDPHLRSARAVTGYYIQASDGDIGHVEDLLVDDWAWAIRYIVVDTRNWLPGKKVLVSPEWITSVRWEDSKVLVDASRERVRASPAYDPDRPIDRDYEELLHDHYGRPRYWEAEPPRRAA